MYLLLKYVKFFFCCRHGAPRNAGPVAFATSAILLIRHWFLVVSDSQLKMSRDDPSFVVVSGGITCQLENISNQVLRNSGEVDWSSGSYSLGVISFPQESVNTTDGKLETSSARASLTLSLYFASFTTTRHDYYSWEIYSANAGSQKNSVLFIEPGD